MNFSACPATSYFFFNSFFWDLFRGLSRSFVANFLDQWIIGCRLFSANSYTAPAASNAAWMWSGDATLWKDPWRALTLSRMTLSSSSSNEHDRFKIELANYFCFIFYYEGASLKMTMKLVILYFVNTTNMSTKTCSSIWISNCVDTTNTWNNTCWSKVFPSLWDWTRNGSTPDHFLHIFIKSFK